MSQKKQKYAHFLQEYFQFATDICASDITSAAIALRFCVELLQCEFASMLGKAYTNQKPETKKKRLKKLLYQSEEILSFFNSTSSSFSV